MLQRDERINIRVAHEERDMLRALAEADGITISDVLRLLVRRAYAERFGDTKPKRKTRPSAR